MIRFLAIVAACCIAGASLLPAEAQQSASPPPVQDSTNPTQARALLPVTTLPQELQQRVAEIAMVGEATIGGRPTVHLAARGPDLDFQVWIERETAKFSKGVAVYVTEFQPDTMNVMALQCGLPPIAATSTIDMCHTPHDATGHTFNEVQASSRRTRDPHGAACGSPRGGGSGNEHPATAIACGSGTHCAISRDDLEKPVRWRFAASSHAGEGANKTGDARCIPMVSTDVDQRDLCRPNA